MEDLGCGLIYYQNFNKQFDQDYSKDVEEVEQEGWGEIWTISVSWQLKTTFYQLKVHIYFGVLYFSLY